MHKYVKWTISQRLFLRRQLRHHAEKCSLIGNLIGILNFAQIFSQVSLPGCVSLTKLEISRFSTRRSLRASRKRRLGSNRSNSQRFVETKWSTFKLHRHQNRRSASTKIRFSWFQGAIQWNETGLFDQNRMTEYFLPYNRINSKPEGALKLS